MSRRPPEKGTVEMKDTENRQGTLLDEAVSFAALAHAGQFRKGTETPYIVHPVEVMKIVCGITQDMEVRMAAVLHDTVEDTPVSRADLEERFGGRVAGLVCAESENKREELPEEETWLIRKQETLDRLEHAERDVKIICLGDKLANIRDIARDTARIDDSFWERFNAPEDGGKLAGKIANVGRYYRGVADRLKSELGGTPEWQELDRLVRAVFKM